MTKSIRERLTEERERINSILRELYEIEEKQFKVTREKGEKMPRYIKDIKQEMENTLINLGKVLDTLNRRVFSPVKFQTLTHETKRILDVLGMKFVPVIKIGYWKNPAEAKKNF